VKSNLKKRKIYLSKLKYVEALGDYVKLIMEDSDPVVVLATMKSFESQLSEIKLNVTIVEILKLTENKSL